MDNTRSVSSVYYDRDSADRAYQSLRDRGYSDSDINVMMSEDTRTRYYGDNPALSLIHI